MKDRKLLGKELGRITAQQYQSSPASGLVVVLDNIRSAHNVGSVFRSCDAFKADKVLLCGISATPPSAEIHKTALGAEFSVPWEHFDNTLDALQALRGDGFTLVSIEQTEHSFKLGSFTPDPSKRYALIFGNEVDGVAQEVVDFSDSSVEVPQFGTKHSLNVSVCAGIVLWEFARGRAVARP